jgi:hypothetical protein
MRPNTPLQPTASRARSFGFLNAFAARLRQLNGNPLDAGHQRISYRNHAMMKKTTLSSTKLGHQNMKWSKLKQQIEDRFADSVRGRMAIHITRYGPGVSSMMTRGWLTWDGEEIFNFSTIEWLLDRAPFSRFDLIDALESYLNLSIEDALSSANALIRAIAMLDRRVGKRRLQQVVIDATTHPFITQLYTLRCTAEHLPVFTTDDGRV